MIIEFKEATKWEQAHWFGNIYELDDVAAVVDVIVSGAPTSGSKAREFEKRFAKYIGVKHAITVSSGAAGMHLAAIGIGIKPGDEVIVPPITFHSTANDFAFQGAKIKFADVDPQTFNIDPQKIEDKITPKTKAIVPVHLCGQPCDMDPIMEIANKNNLTVIEDCAHIPGGEYKERKVGSLGDIGVFSFQQTKNISTLGEGGMITTNNDTYAEEMTLYREHGNKGLYTCFCPGLNYRMTDSQAAVGIVQLGKLDRFNEARRRLAHYLTEQLKEVRGIKTPYEDPNIKHVYHLYNSTVEKDILGIDRDAFIKRLAEEYGILATTQYPCVHLFPYYREQGHKEGECPVSETIAKKIVTLPMAPRLTKEDMDYVANAIKKIAK